MPKVYNMSQCIVDRILPYVKMEWQTTRQIVDASKCSNNTVRNYLEALTKQGRVTKEVRECKERKGNTLHWRLPCQKTNEQKTQ